MPRLARLDALSEAAPEMPQTIHAADIGPSDWFYVHALYAALKWWNSPTGRTVRLTGYEADAYGVYSALFSRYDLAHGYLTGLEEVHYIPRKFTRQPGKFDMTYSGTYWWQNMTPEKKDLRVLKV